MNNEERPSPKQMAENLVTWYSVSDEISQFYAKMYARMAVDLVLSAHPTKKISSTSIEYDYEYWNEVKLHL